MVDFVTIGPSNLEKSWSCPVCLDTDKADVVAHPGEGEKHPLHRACFERALKQNNTCPICREPLAERDIEKIDPDDHSCVRISEKYSRRNEGRDLLVAALVVNELVNNRRNFYYDPFYVDPFFGFGSFSLHPFYHPRIVVFL